MQVRLPELNLVLLNGRLTRDPEIFFTTGGIARCSFAIAVNRRVKDGKSGEWKDDTLFIDVVVWREQAERCKEKLKKGSPVHVEGRLRAREYESHGQKRKVVEIEARRVQYLATDPVPAAKAESGNEGASSDEHEEVPF